MDERQRSFQDDPRYRLAPGRWSLPEKCDSWKGNTDGQGTWLTLLGICEFGEEWEIFVEMSIEGQMQV